MAPDAELRNALEHLVELAFWQLCFFDLVDEDVLDLDTAVQQLEQLTHSLHAGGDVVRAEFERLAARVAREDIRPAVRAFAERAPRDVWDDER